MPVVSTVPCRDTDDAHTNNERRIELATGAMRELQRDLDTIARAGCTLDLVARFDLMQPATLEYHIKELASLVNLLSDIGDIACEVRWDRMNRARREN